MPQTMGMMIRLLRISVAEPAFGMPRETIVGNMIDMKKAIPTTANIGNKPEQNMAATDNAALAMAYANSRRAGVTNFIRNVPTKRPSMVSRAAAPAEVVGGDDLRDPDGLCGVQDENAEDTNLGAHIEELRDNGASERTWRNALAMPSCLAPPSASLVPISSNVNLWKMAAIQNSIPRTGAQKLYSMHHEHYDSYLR